MPETEGLEPAGTGLDGIPVRLQIPGGGRGADDALRLKRPMPIAQKVLRTQKTGAKMASKAFFEAHLRRFFFIYLDIAWSDPDRFRISRRKVQNLPTVSM